MGSLWPEVTEALQENRRELVLSGEEISERLQADDGLPADLYRLTKLNFLEISNAQLDTISEDVRLLPNLTRLVLHSNCLACVPEEISQLVNLKQIDLSNNKLTALPFALSSLLNLQVVNCSNNQLTEFVDVSKWASTLIELNLDKNKLTEIPQSLWQNAKFFAHFSSLQMRQNLLTDIPHAMRDFPVLKVLSLAENRIEVVPGELGDCPKLKELNMIGNPLKDRRLLKMLQDSHSKTQSVLEYIRKHCQKTGKTADKASGKVKKTKAKNKPTTAGNAENGDKEMDTITVLPAASSVQVNINPEVSSVRPFLVCCVVEGLQLAENSNFRKFIVIQNKLHDSDKGCNRRMDATIATHDLRLIRFPLVFTVSLPEELKIRPLRSTQEASGEELVAKLTEEAELLRKKEKRNVYSGIHKYHQRCNWV